MARLASIGPRHAGRPRQVTPPGRCVSTHLHGTMLAQVDDDARCLRESSASQHAVNFVKTLLPSVPTSETGFGPIRRPTGGRTQPRWRRWGCKGERRAVTTGGWIILR
eukprot:362401-Chlamydomonas_euryale.AAC.7